MTDPSLEDHVTGLEQQLVELVERKERARVQHDEAEMRRLEREIEAVQDELVRTAEQLAAG